jgi:hypothetical protein
METDSFPRHVDVEIGVTAPGILMLALSSGIQAPVVLPQLLVVLGVIFDDVFSY